MSASDGQFLRSYFESRCCMGAFLPDRCCDIYTANSGSIWSMCGMSMLRDNTHGRLMYAERSESHGGFNDS